MPFAGGFCFHYHSDAKHTLRYIKNVDKRTSRLDHRRDFRYAITRFRGVTEADVNSVSKDDSDSSNQIRIYARKRPMLFAKEIKKDFDVKNNFNGTSFVDAKKL